MHNPAGQHRRGHQCVPNNIEGRTDAIAGRLGQLLTASHGGGSNSVLVFVTFQARCQLQDDNMAPEHAADHRSGPKPPTTINDEQKYLSYVSGLELANMYVNELRHWEVASLDLEKTHEY